MIVDNSKKIKDLQEQKKKILEKIKSFETIFKEEKDNEECWPGHSSTRYQTAGNELQVLTELLENIEKEIKKNE